MASGAMAVGVLHSWGRKVEETCGSGIAAPLAIAPWLPVVGQVQEEIFPLPTTGGGLDGGNAGVERTVELETAASRAVSL